ncbi:MAG: hypothetical protein A2283_07250 [Lentisphaerae bacterium RIFOXYA12_FULL_48_11]|nr:MAG: hypothetical protein A2283_07250 [Lentisphaerae bacterium RIFOXYA12_FULL_48_11]
MKKEILRHPHGAGTMPGIILIAITSKCANTSNYGVANDLCRVAFSLFPIITGGAIFCDKSIENAADAILITMKT